MEDSKLFVVTYFSVTQFLSLNEMFVKTSQTFTLSCQHRFCCQRQKNIQVVWQLIIKHTYILCQALLFGIQNYIHDIHSIASHSWQILVIQVCTNYNLAIRSLGYAGNA